MMRNSLIILSLLLFYSTSAFAADVIPVGRIKNASGAAFILRGTETVSAIPGMSIGKSDTIMTGKQGTIGIVFNDNSTLSLGSNSKFQLAQYEFNVLEKKIGFVGRIMRGSMVYLSGLIAKMNAEATRFETPVAVAGVRGTKLAIKVEGNENE